MKAWILFAALSLWNTSAYSSDAPVFPFADWRHLAEEASSFVGDMGACGPDETQPFVGYLIRRTDGLWRIFAPADPQESDVWFAVWMDPRSAFPKWAWLGLTRENDLVAERVEPYDTAKHNDACAILFPRRGFIFGQ